jgi:alpha-amylase/alpha-mannosidase (GH57 family)
MTKVAILWHMHQPYYEDLVTGEHILPWVRLHALKDYYGMVALLREFPDVRLTFNLVPSLCVQLEAFAEERARDRSLDLSLKPAASLNDDDKRFILANFFHAHRARMIDAYPRYGELLKKREAANQNGGALRAFSEGDFRDLQVWHKLAWIDPLFMASDSRVLMLLAKGRGFSEDDKALLRAVELDVIRAVMPEYRAAAERGQVELSASPFYHPILPLLCDTDIYLRTHPHSRTPRQRFRHPDDARSQLEKAVTAHARFFGSTPVGLWPSEGSVSDAMVPLAAEAGFRWMATDELILARSLNTALTRDGYGHLDQPETLYRPYLVRAGGREVACLFRDHVLSDLIGFTYASWSPESAAQDFVGRLIEAGRRYASRTGAGQAVIPIILDGENAWEHYEGQGRPFLRALYRMLSTTPELQTVTMAEAASAVATPLNGVFPGSWINADFYIWIGHGDDHRAWGQLADARQALDAPGPAATAEGIARAREELFVAEGSDWFWWYGDDHSSEHDLEFDDLFRRHLRNVYRSVDKPVPEELYVTNITTQPPHTVAYEPVGMLHPTLDGEPTSYFEWVAAGELELSTSSGSMHQVAGARRPQVRAIRFGFSLEALFVRVDFERRAQDLLIDKGEIQLRFFKPAGHRLRVMRSSDGGLEVNLLERKGPGDWQPKPQSAPRAGVATILEVGIRFIDLGVTAGDSLSFFVALFQDGHALEQYPPHVPLDLTVPGADFNAKFWSV